MEGEECPNDLHKLLNQYLNLLNGNLVPFNYLSLNLLIQALESYDNFIYDGAVILCRTIIDSSLYLACLYKRNSNKEDTSKFCLDTPKEFDGNDIINWGNIKEAAKNILYTNEINKEGKVCKLEKINKNVRELGNFAAHIGERQFKEHNKWYEENKDKYIDILNKVLTGDKFANLEKIEGYKSSTTTDEAELGIRETIMFLMDLVNVYSSHCS